MKDVFGFECESSEHETLLRAQLDGAAAIVWERLNATKLACEIYDAHVISDDEHSCLGCNLNEACYELWETLAATSDFPNQRVRLHLCLSLVNVLWERIRDTCKTLAVPERLWDASEQEFASFKLSRRWANFMKHPGFFGMGIHHPIYLAAGSSGAILATIADGKVAKGPREWILIDSEVVKDCWSSDTSGSEFKKKLKGAFTACVLLPDMEAIAEGICSEFTGFVNRMKEPTWVELAREHAVADVPCEWW